MKSERIIWGLVLVFVGSILLLDNFGVIDFYWRSVWRFWPLILILSGLNLVFARAKENPIVKTLLILATLFILGFVAYVGTTQTYYKPWFSQSDEADTEPESPKNSTFSEPFNPATTKAELHIEGGATSYELNESTADLFEAKVQRAYGKYTLSKTSTDSVEVLTFKMQGKNQHWDLDKAKGNRVKLFLNTQPIWSVFLDMGAGKADFDFSAYQLQNLTIKGGAAAFDVKLGQPLQTTQVTVETGVSEVSILVPETAACQITCDGGLTSKSFKNFDKKSDGVYETPNFNRATNKITIKLNGGLSAFKVKRY